MHCPNCGTKASAGQKFCRACGFSLEKVEQLIADQKAADTEQTTRATAGLSDDWLRRLEKWVSRALMALCGITISLIIWTIIVNVMIKERGIFVGSMFLALVIGVVLASILAYLKGERINPASIRSYRQHHLSRAQETAKMLSEPSVEMAAGVTEQTTANLAERNER